ncbi:hypothetical protein M501DRAFT_919965, partial [Patellaria atrata CBS 101060]
RLFQTDEELGKRDDDHKLRTTLPSRVWRAAPRGYRKRRVFLALAGLFLVWLFIHNIPTDLGPAAQRLRPLAKPSPPMSIVAPTGAPPRTSKGSAEATQEHYYNGIIKFYELGASLKAFSRRMGYSMMNRNVLFAASSLESASTLLPLACEMAKVDRNNVHMALMGREDIKIDDFLDINSVNSSECHVTWHDARPDYSLYSSDERAEACVAAALGHINNYLHPKVAITDDSINEDQFFVRGLRTQAAEQGPPIIELPRRNRDKLNWITKLGAWSLSSWHTATIDILIQAPAESSEALAQLLRSIKHADYTGLKYPRLTIELPYEIDSHTQRFLEEFKWPPPIKQAPIKDNQLILRRRLPSHKLSTEEASTRFIESFWPSSSTNAHVLLLSPNVQLSPSYFQYVMYNVLEYKYSSYIGALMDKVIGLSLDLPSTYLNGTTSLTPPTVANMDDVAGATYINYGPNSPTPFLWQAPNSNAVLYFGESWIEIHSFLTSRLAKQHSATPPPQRRKLVSETLPSWMEYLLELMRARGYSIIYPGIRASNALATVHNELYQPPEEFTKPALNDNDDGHTPPKPNPDSEKPEPFLTTPTPPPKPNNPELPLSSQPLHLLLPFDASLPDISHLPQLSFSGSYLTGPEAWELAQLNTKKFREGVGGCEEGRRRKVFKGSAGDLFCFPG